MNPETVTLIERPYQEIVDDILTAVVGGVVNEPIIFDVKIDLYPLAEPAKDVRGITGTLNREGHAFQKEIDFLFSAENNAVIWQEGGTWPDDDTVFHVDYFRKESRSPLTDINVGSVTRTLSEAIGREIATVYQQINRAYLSAFIETAEGKSLDLVVAILGINRKTKDFAVGLVTFFRDPAIQDNITIPEGTLLATAKGEVIFQTTQLRTLQRGQVRIDVPIRASDDFKGEVGKVAAGTITQLVQPIAGIARVSNFEPTILGAEDESDEELRARAKAVLRALGKGTLAALARVIFKGRGVLTEVWDPNSPPAKRSKPGTVVLMVESEPERFPSLRAAVEETRAAGVQATLLARYVFFKPRIVAQITPGLTAAGKLKVIDEIIAALQAYVDGLSSGDPAEGQALLKAVTDVEDVSKKETRIVDVMAWRADVGRQGAETMVETILTALQGVPSDDPEALRATVTGAVSEVPSLVPSGRRIADRGLVQGPTGERATDEEIEAGDFQVTAVIDSNKWWVVLDIERADIVLQEEGR
jgi:hypothetical protein